MSKPMFWPEAFVAVAALIFIAVTTLAPIAAILLVAYWIFN